MAEIPDLSSNPYAPPEVHEPSAVVHELWKIQDGDLWVRNGAHIPGVDLATGEVDPDRPVIRQLTLTALGPGVILQVMLSSGVLAGFSYLKSHLWLGASFIWPILLIFLVSILIRPWTGSSFFALSYPESRKRARKRRALGAGVLLCALAMFACVALPFVFSFRPNYRLMMVGVGVFLICMLVMAVAATLFGNSPKAGNASDGWLRLKAINAGAIDHLRTLPSPHRGTPDPNGRWYLIHMEKFSWLSWCRILRWQPRPCLRIGFVKLTGRAMTTRSALQLQPTHFEAGCISEPFRQRMGALEAELIAGGWSFYAWDRLVVPDGFSAEMASFLHRDHRDVLTLSETTSGAGKPFFGIFLHSWLEDGSVLRTSNERTFPIMNPAVQWVYKPDEELFSLISQHLQRSSGLRAVALVDGHDADRRLIQLALDNHAWLHARGIYGALEEIYA